MARGLSVRNRDLLSVTANTFTIQKEQTMTDTLAIEGGSPVRGEPFPAWPIWDEREEKALLDVLHSGHWGVLDGDKVQAFERAFAAYQGARHGVCVMSGTAGLEIGLRALGVGAGDEVITTPYTFMRSSPRPIPLSPPSTRSSP
jgi:hypothetical protein